MGNEYFSRIYKKDGFAARIQLNLANISASPTDEFQLVNTYYNPRGFKCELCGHDHCLYAFTVKNIKTTIDMTVGSECIHHFKDKGVNIDLAEGLLKRVMKATAEARNLLREELGRKAFELLPASEKALIKAWKVPEKIEELGKAALKSMSLKEKAEATVQAYMVVQAIELLADVSRNKHTLTKEEVENIVSLGLEDKMTKAQERAEKNAIWGDYITFHKDFNEYIGSIRPNSMDPARKQEFYNRFQKFIDSHLEGSMQKLDTMVATYENEIAQFGWLTACQIKDPVLDSIKGYLTKYHTLTDRQVNLAKQIIDKATSGPKADEEFETAINWLCENCPSDFVTSVKNFYSQKHFVSPKQRYMIMKLYGINHK